MGMLGKLDEEMARLDLEPVVPIDDVRLRKPRPLGEVIADFVVNWSKAFVSLADGGDPEAIALVGQLSVAEDGYGIIEHSEEQGAEWQEKLKTSRLRTYSEAIAKRVNDKAAEMNPLIDSGDEGGDDEEKEE